MKTNLFSGLKHISSHADMADRMVESSLAVLASDTDDVSKRAKQILADWLSALPAHAYAEYVNCLRQDDDGVVAGAFFEIAFYTYLRKCNIDITQFRARKGGSRPDFKLKLPSSIWNVELKARHEHASNKLRAKDLSKRVLIPIKRELDKAPIDLSVIAWQCPSQQLTKKEARQIADSLIDHHRQKLTDEYLVINSNDTYLAIETDDCISDRPRIRSLAGYQSTIRSDANIRKELREKRGQHSDHTDPILFGIAANNPLYSNRGQYRAADILFGELRGSMSSSSTCCTRASNGFWNSTQDGATEAVVWSEWVDWYGIGSFDFELWIPSPESHSELVSIWPGNAWSIDAITLEPKQIKFGKHSSEIYEVDHIDRGPWPRHDLNKLLNQSAEN